MVTYLGSEGGEGGCLVFKNLEDPEQSRKTKSLAYHFARGKQFEAATGVCSGCVTFDQGSDSRAVDKFNTGKIYDHLCMIPRYEIGDSVLEQLLIFANRKIAVEVEQGYIPFFSLTNFELTIHFRTCQAKFGAKYLFA